MSVAEKIKILIKFRGLSINKLAKKIGVSHVMIGRIIKNQSSPTLETLNKISKGLDIPLYLILSDEELDFAEMKLEHMSMWSYIRAVKEAELLRSSNL